MSFSNRYAGHFKEVCRGCSTVIAQCRCAGPKTVEYIDAAECPFCRDKSGDPATPPAWGNDETDFTDPGGKHGAGNVPEGKVVPPQEDSLYSMQGHNRADVVNYTLGKLAETQASKEAGVSDAMQAFRPDPVPPLVYLDEITPMLESDWEYLVRRAGGVKVEQVPDLSTPEARQEYARWEFERRRVPGQGTGGNGGLE